MGRFIMGMSIDEDLDDEEQEEQDDKQRRALAALKAEAERWRAEAREWKSNYGELLADNRAACRELEKYERAAERQERKLLRSIRAVDKSKRVLSHPWDLAIKETLQDERSTLSVSNRNRSIFPKMLLAQLKAAVRHYLKEEAKS